MKTLLDAIGMQIDLSPLLQYWPFLLNAVEMTVLISFLSICLGVTIGVPVGAARAFGGRVVYSALGLYVDSVRAIPVLVILIWTYFAFPLVLNTSLSPITAGVLALGFHLGAFVSETIRSGLTSIRLGQMRAALSLGMSQSQAIRTIILPQALIRMLPALASLLVLAIKETAIAAVIAVPELMRQSQVLAGKTYRPFEIYTAAMLVYFVLCFPITRIVDWIYRRVWHLGAS